MSPDLFRLTLVKSPLLLSLEKCHFKLVEQFGRGSNRNAIYKCQHPQHFCVGFKGFTTKGKAAHAR